MSDNKTIVTRSRTKYHGEKIETPPFRTAKNRDPSSASSQMHSKERKEVRVGEGCQVALTDVESSYIGDDNYENYCEDLDVMVWNGGKDLKDEDVVEYIQHAAKTHRIPVDKALYMLHASNNDIVQAKLELFGHINLEDNWTADDDRVFWYAFQAFGKNFAKIKQLLPHKKMPSIINHYYATKKQQYYKSVLNDEMGKSATFDLSDDEEAEPQKRSHVYYICKNCGASVQRTYHANLLEVCKSCKLYFKVANEHRPVNRPRQFDKRVTCPPEMVEIAEQFAEMALESRRTVEEDDVVVCVDRPTRTVCDDLIEETHIKIDSNKAKAHILNSKNNAIDYNEFCDIKKSTELLERISNEKTSSRQRHSHTWSDFEQAAAFHCLIRFNNNYEAVAEVIGNKTTDMVKAFALENQDAIRKAIEEQQALDVEINVEDELPKAPPAEIIDLD